MRCFIAINLPDKIKEKISDITKNFPEKGIKKVGEHNLHLTLKFLGEVDKNKLEEIKKILEKINCQKFDVSLKDFGFFPNTNFIKVVWIGIEKGNKEIIELQKQIDSELEKSGFKKEKGFSVFDRKYFPSKMEKGFEPHLTIARVKFLENKKEFLDKMNKLKFEDNFSVSSFDLVESILKKEGPVYRKILGVELI